MDFSRREIALLPAQDRRDLLPRSGRILGTHDLLICEPFAESFSNYPQRLIFFDRGMAPAV
jgi:hypothetical protein